MDDEIRSLVMQNADAATLRRKCTSVGMTLLRQDGAARVLRGETRSKSCCGSRRKTSTRPAFKFFHRCQYLLIEVLAPTVAPSTA